MLKRLRQNGVSTWRLEPEGEAEVPEIIIVSDAVKGTKVDLDGEGHQVERMKEIPKKWRQPKGEDWTEMKKEAESYWCTLLNGLAWSTEKKFLRRYKGKCDIFFFWDGAQVEEGGNGGTVQQRSQGRMEICS